METPLVSIIVPIYNVEERFLTKCIESLIKQTLKMIEIILVDDGSTDKSGKICDKYAKQDKRIKVIHKINGGLSSARNAGFLAAEGDWILFVDGDDWIVLDTCHVMYKTAIQNDVQIVICGLAKDYGNRIVKFNHRLEDNKIYIGKECKWLQKQVLVYSTQISTSGAKLISREFLIKHNVLHDEQLRQGAEGLEFNLRLFEKIEKAIFINQALYHYVSNSSSISTSHNERNHKYVLECFEKIREQILEKDNKEELLPWFYNRLLYVVVTTAISGYFNPANEESYSLKKKKYISYLKDPLIIEAIDKAPRTGISFQRKIILFLIKYRFFIILNLLGYLRKKQKEYK